MTKASAKKRRTRGPGRLSAEETEALADRLLDAAQAVFIAHGYARATMDAIAQAAGASRKTIYARYANKEEVLAAVIQRFLDLALPRAQAMADTPLEHPRAALTMLGASIAAAASHPMNAGLNRIIASEGHQFPEVARLAIQLQSVAVTGVRLTLERLHAAGHLPGLDDAQRAAQIFIEMAVSIQRRNAMLGLPTSKKESDALVATAISLFLDGCAHER
jgi:AcrR family transcriptional regulator